MFSCSQTSSEDQKEKNEDFCVFAGLVPQSSICTQFGQQASSRSFKEQDLYSFQIKVEERNVDPIKEEKKVSKRKPYEYPEEIKSFGYEMHTGDDEYREIGGDSLKYLLVQDHNSSEQQNYESVYFDLPNMQQQFIDPITSLQKFISEISQEEMMFRDKYEYDWQKQSFNGSEKISKQKKSIENQYEQHESRQMQDNILKMLQFKQTTLLCFSEFKYFILGVIYLQKLQYQDYPKSILQWKTFEALRFLLNKQPSIAAVYQSSPKNIKELYKQELITLQKELQQKCKSLYQQIQQFGKKINLFGIKVFLVLFDPFFRSLFLLDIKEKSLLFSIMSMIVDRGIKPITTLLVSILKQIINSGIQISLKSPEQVRNFREKILNHLKSIPESALESKQQYYNLKIRILLDN